MECNCKDNDRAVIPWVRGNRLPLVICVYEDVVTQEGEGSLVHNKMERVPYEIQAADTVTVVMKSGFRQVEMPFTTEGNKVLVTDNGELAAGTYTVEVTIVRGDGARGRWQETRQVRVYENTSDAQLGEMYAIEADLFFYAKGDTGNGIADITANADDTLTITMTDGTTYTTKAMRGEKGDKGDKGDTGTSIVSFEATGQTDVSVIYTVTYSDGTTQEVAVPKGPQGDTGLTGNGIASTTLNNDYTLTVNYTDGTSYTTPSIRGAQGVQGVSIIAFTQTGETSTNTLYNVVFSDGRTQSVAIPKGVKGDKGDAGNTGSQGAQGPKGDTVTATDYTLYNVQGSSSEGAMSQDATTKAISAQTGYYTCETAAGTAAKVVTVESGNLYKRTLGGHFKVKMTNANTAASGVTLQVGSETATALWYNGAAVSASNSWEAGEIISVFYDGNRFMASNSQGGGGKAEKIKYDNSRSRFDAENVQDAIDKLSEEFVGILQPIVLGQGQYGFLKAGTNGWQPMGAGDSGYQTHYLIIRTKEMRYIAITPNDGGIAQVGFFKTYQYDSPNPTTTFSDIVSGRQEITNDDLIKIPSDCSYIVINGYNTKNISRKPTAVKISYDTIEYNTVDVSAIKENIGAVDATTGNIDASDTSQFNADIIIPEGATHVNFQVIKTSSTYGVAFLSNDGVFISGYYNTTVGSGTRATIDIPKHAAIFRFGYLVRSRNFDFVRFVIPIRNSVYANGIKTITPTIIDGYTINKMGTIAANSEYCYTTPIYLRAGETIGVISSTGGYSVISQTDSNGTVYVPLVFSTNGGTNVVYEYTALFDMYVALCYKKQNAEIYLREKRSGTYYGGMYIFSFKTIANKDIWIYKDTLFTGLKPLENYEVFVKNAEASLIKNQTKRALKFKASAGNYEVRLFARNIYNELIFRKDIQIKVVKAPSVKLSTKSSFNVMFFGDSIIGQNHNKIGAEFHRYLSSDDAGGTNEDGSIEPPAINVCQSKMNLVGEMNLSNTRFQYLLKAEMAMTGKRDLPYGDPNANNITYFQSHNPFYNPNSSQPDEIGQDGFNKRVDFGWYFQNACGNGKYPDLIYMSIGANDIGTGDTYWSGNSVSITVERVVAICKKMKAACDTIAGGVSNLRIKIFNHQSYPLDFASYNNLPIEQARLVQTMYYTKLYYQIIHDGISDYVEFVDCASKFDIANGYDMGDVNSNSRTVKANDYGLLRGDGVHMNQTGAFNYADCLINDFLADSNFD